MGYEALPYSLPTTTTDTHTHTRTSNGTRTQAHPPIITSLTRPTPQLVRMKMPTPVLILGSLLGSSGRQSHQRSSQKDGSLRLHQINLEIDASSCGILTLNLTKVIMWEGLKAKLT